MAQNNRIYIDLPGESWEYSTFNGQLDVVLRRPRDVIININLPSPFAKFTLESDKDWFYDVKSKKRVQRMEYANGERVHLWLGRNFKGCLTLKSNKTVYANFDIAKIFEQEKTHSLFDDYAYKPAPLILEACKENQSEQIGISPQQETMHIVEMKSAANAPDYIVTAIRTGAESLNLDSQNVITINWILGQIAGSAGYGLDNKQWIAELWNKSIRLQRVMHKSGPKMYIVFKGNARTRQLLTASRYAADNAKVLSILAGAGSFKGAAKAAWNAANPALTAGEGLKIRPTGAGIAVVFSITVSVAEWYADYCKLDKNGKPSKDFFDLAGSVGIGLAKTLIAGGVASLALSIAASFGLILAFTPVGLVIAGVAIGISVATGFLVDWLDKKYSVTDKTTAGLRKSWEYLESKEPNSYQATYRPYGASSSFHPAATYPATLTK